MNNVGRHHVGNWIKHWIGSGRCARPSGGNNGRFGKPCGKGGWRLGGGRRRGNGRPPAPSSALLRPAEHN